MKGVRRLTPIFLCGCGFTVLEIIGFIIVAVIIFIFVVPFLNTFGSNSKYQSHGKIDKTKEAFKQVGQNYKTTMKASESVLNALGRGLDSLNKYLDKVNADSNLNKTPQYNKHTTIKDERARQKIKWIMYNERNKKRGLKELNFKDFLKLPEREKCNGLGAKTTQMESYFVDMLDSTKDLDTRKKLDAINRKREAAEAREQRTDCF